MYRGYSGRVESNGVLSLLIQFVRLLPWRQKAVCVAVCFICVNGLLKWAVDGITQIQNKNRRSDRIGNFKGDHAVCSVVVREASISTQHVFSISNDISWLFYDLLQ